MEKKIILALMALLLITGIVVYWSDHNSKPTQEVADSSTSTPQALPEEYGIVTNPEHIEQGDPVLITITGVDSIEEITSFTLNGKVLNLFMHEGNPSALIGFDLRGPTGIMPLVLTLGNGEKIEKKLVVNEKLIAKAPLGIPDNLGGNTPQAEKELINTLVEEGRLISRVPTAKEKLWEGDFQIPLDPPIVVTDTYGYSRLTGATTISHKGTDYRAPVGTPIYSMNAGVVVFAQSLRNYGNTVIVDHGLGLQTVYMHLSQIKAALNQRVEKGELVGLAGDTGYTFGPHLHLTVRINGISIDPEKFLGLFNEI